MLHTTTQIVPGGNTNGFFEASPVLDSGLERDPNTRLVQGNGEKQLPVPGLKKLVRIRGRGGTLDIATPEAPEIREYPMDLATAEKSSRNYVQYQVYFMRLVQTDNGPALEKSALTGVREFSTNDFYFVNGEWEDTPSAAAPAADGKPGRETAKR